MSCGNPHADDCAEVLQRMFLFLDREIADADSAQIQRHLDECGPCLAKYNLEQAVKALVARSCREQAPQRLRDRLLLQIRHVSVEVSDLGHDPGFPR
ncbi:MAG: mycothiol system anti-sigma-R factor [Actinomycetota bacterium]|nr:mycothiol system anti-sigma-R factor [Actinomycetota bacterium]